MRLNSYSAFAWAAGMKRGNAVIAPAPPVFKFAPRKRRVMEVYQIQDTKYSAQDLNLSLKGYTQKYRLNHFYVHQILFPKILKRQHEL